MSRGRSPSCIGQVSTGPGLEGGGEGGGAKYGEAAKFCLIVHMYYIRITCHPPHNYRATSKLWLQRMEIQSFCSSQLLARVPRPDYTYDVVKAGYPFDPSNGLCGTLYASPYRAPEALNLYFNLDVAR